jgi:hypothetical protein
MSISDLLDAECSTNALEGYLRKWSLLSCFFFLPDSRYFSYFTVMTNFCL